MSFYFRNEFSGSLEWCRLRPLQRSQHATKRLTQINNRTDGADFKF